MRVRPRFSGPVLGLAILILTLKTAPAAQLPLSKDMDWQPFAAQVKHLIDATDYLGSPLNARDKRELEAALNSADQQAGSEKAQGILDKYCLFAIDINPEMRVKVLQVPAK